MKPYKENKIEEHKILRLFTESVDNKELVWHRDAEDRIITIKECDEWYLQMDNETPVLMENGKEHFIPKNTYHRVIKGEGNLMVEITKLDEDDRCVKIAKRKYDVWPSAYASGAVVRCRKGEIWKNESDDKLEEKTDYSKEKDKGLHGWFERQGGKGKSKGWVDCNTCKTNPKTKRKECKSCGRKEGEERKKYPSCRPTPSACSTKGKGKKWGKKTNESMKQYKIYENQLINLIEKITLNKLNEGENEFFFDETNMYKYMVDALYQLEDKTNEEIAEILEKTLNRDFIIKRK